MSAATTTSNDTKASKDGLVGPEQILESEEYITTKADGAVKIRFTEDEYGKMSADSVPGTLMKAAEEVPDIVALSVKRENKWVNWTYKEYLEEVRIVAKAFIQLGLEPRKSVGILGFNSPEWFMADMAAVFANGIAVGIYATNSPEMCQYMANHSRCNILVVEDEKQLEKILKVKSELTDLKAIVQYTGTPKHEGVLSWQDLLQRGKAWPYLKNKLEERLKQVAINQCCRLVYTSGTTGAPKGVMLSHDNLLFTAKTMSKLYDLNLNGQERNVSYLPLSHVAASMMDNFVILSCRGTTYFADKNALKGTLTQTLQETTPTLFFGVPRVWEKIQEKMLEVGRANKGLKRQIGNWAKSTGLQYNRAMMKCSTVSMWPEMKYKIADRMVFQKVKTALGLHKCKSFFVAAAPISIETLEYFLSLDIRIFDIYGMSECSGPQTFNCTEEQRVGSIGKGLPGCSTRLAVKEDPDCIPGEILMKGRNIMMGYLEDLAKTNEAINQDGFLKSGDLGSCDSAGFFRITGRAKEILITAGGENVAPIPIEETIKKQLPCVANAMLIGDRKKFLSVLLTLKTEVDPVTLEPLPELAPITLEWCSSIGSKAKTIQDIVDDPDEIVMKAIQEGIDLTNDSSVSNAQKVQKWKILRKDFSVPGGELGPTLKMKRHFVLQQYADLVNGFYE